MWNFECGFRPGGAIEAYTPEGVGAFGSWKAEFGMTFREAEV